MDAPHKLCQPEMGSLNRVAHVTGCVCTSEHGHVEYIMNVTQLRWQIQAVGHFTNFLNNLKRAHIYRC